MHGHAVPVPVEGHLKVGAGILVPQGRREGACVHQVQHRVHVARNPADRLLVQPVLNSPGQSGQVGPDPGLEPRLNGLVRKAAPYQAEAVAVTALAA